MAGASVGNGVGMVGTAVGCAGGESADPGVVVGASVAMVCMVGAAVGDGVPAARSGVTGVGTATGLGAGVGVATR